MMLAIRDGQNQWVPAVATQRDVGKVGFRITLRLLYLVQRLSHGAQKLAQNLITLKPPHNLPLPAKYEASIVSDWVKNDHDISRVHSILTDTIAPLLVVVVICCGTTPGLVPVIGDAGGLGFPLVSPREHTGGAHVSHDRQDWTERNF